MALYGWNALYFPKGTPAPIVRACHACTSGYTRSYLRHLARCNELGAPMLGTLHNLYYYEKLMADMRAAIAARSW